MKIGFKKIHPDAVLPKYAHVGDAGMDVYAISDQMLDLNVPTLVKTGLVADIPAGYEIQVRPRSNSKMLQHKDASWFTVSIRCHECRVSVYGADRFDKQEAFDDAVERWNRREGK